MIGLLIPVTFLLASFTMLPAQDSTSIPLTRFQPSDLRIMSYNILFGGIVDQEAPIQRSNVMLFNPNTQKGDRVGFKTLEDNRKVRYFKSNGEVIDI